MWLRTVMVNIYVQWVSEKKKSFNLVDDHSLVILYFTAYNKYLN